MFLGPLGEFPLHPSCNRETEAQRNEGNGLRGDRVSQQPDQEVGLCLSLAGFLYKHWSSPHAEEECIQVTLGRGRVPDIRHPGQWTRKSLPRWGFPLPSPASLGLGTCCPQTLTPCSLPGCPPRSLSKAEAAPAAAPGPLAAELTRARREL